MKNSPLDKKQVLPLPPESSPDYFRVLVKNCIAAYSKLFSDKLALDYNKVVSRSLRAEILGDNEYQEETRSLKARQMMAEVEEIEELALLADGKDGGEGDPRERGKKKVTTADKDMLNMRFKAAQMRRDILRLSVSDDDQDEADSLNLFFVAVSREEFERLETVEVHAGDGDGKSALAEESNKSLPRRKEIAKRLAGLGASPEEQTLEDAVYKTNEDGSITEVVV